MITWGISANSHDAALAVFNKDGLCFAGHAERFSGVKNDPHLNQDIIYYALQWGIPQQIYWYEKPLLKTLRQLKAGQGLRLRENNVKNYLKNFGIRSPITTVKHHTSHAAGGYYTSGFDDATVVCIDAIGEFETLTIWHADASGLTQLHKLNYPHSVGLWYSAMTQRLGLRPNQDEYILMGMSAYADAKYLRNQIKYDFFTSTEYPIQLKRNLHKGCLDWRPEFKEEKYFDIAAGVQSVYEEVFENILKFAKQTGSSNNLVLAGGCALNCKANNIAHKYFKNIWIMPNPGDAGSALGCVLSAHKKQLNLDHMYHGYDIQGEYPVEQTVKELLNTGICGVANGRAEFGPRAFGNRSLFADPRGDDIKDRVNAIKQRQKFRPFAPAVLSEHVAEQFDGPANSYMQFTARCKNPDLYPAITHADGTSRVQVVHPDGSGIRRLLEAWYEATGCPMLLNTSLNIKNKPMINNLTDAQEFAKMYKIKVFS